MHIVQIAPGIAPGTGVAGVAWNLEQQWRALGHTVDSFTMAQLRSGKSRREPRTRVGRALLRIGEAVEFTVLGTRAAKRFLAEHPGAASVCHNAVLAGDVYVNHGVLLASMRARGHWLWRILRNPLHVFTVTRDRIRYRGHTHRAIVALASSEADTLRRTYGRVGPPIRIIPNGVDLERFRPPTPEERRQARELFHLDDEHRVVLFVGHEFDRKGLPLAIAALQHAPTVMLLVVGGNADTIAGMTELARTLGVSERVLFVGKRSDLPQMLAAADMFTLPSAYEANALVVLEALAAGVPVIGTAVGFAPEIIRDGVNGELVPRDAAALAAAFERFALGDVEDRRAACRASVEHLTWRASAEAYIELLSELHPDGDGG